MPSTNSQPRKTQLNTVKHDHGSHRDTPDPRSNISPLRYRTSQAYAESFPCLSGAIYGSFQPIFYIPNTKNMTTTHTFHFPIRALIRDANRLNAALIDPAIGLAVSRRKTLSLANQTSSSRHCSRPKSSSLRKVASPKAEPLAKSPSPPRHHRRHPQGIPQSLRQ